MKSTYIQPGKLNNVQNYIISLKLTKSGNADKLN